MKLRGVRSTYYCNLLKPVGRFEGWWLTYWIWELIFLIKFIKNSLITKCATYNIQLKVWFVYQSMIMLIHNQHHHQIFSTFCKGFNVPWVGSLLSCQQLCVQILLISAPWNLKNEEFSWNFQIHFSQKDVYYAFISWWIYHQVTDYDQKPVELRMYFAEAILYQIRMVCLSLTSQLGMLQLL